MNMLISRRMKKCVAWIMAVVMLTGDILLNSVTDPDTPWDTWSSSTEGLNSWNSIGEYKSADDNRPFAGTFDGEGHTVSGLWTCTRTRTTNGLFGYSTGVIKNVNVEKSYIEGSGYGVGGIVNCYNQGNVTVSQNGGYCGTVAGALERAGFDSCGKVSYSYWKNDISPSEPVGYTGEGTFTEATCRKYSSDYTLYTVLDAETGVDFTIDVSSETADRLADALDKWTQAKNCGSKEVGIARWTAGSGGPVFASEAADTWNGNAAAILDGKMTLTWDSNSAVSGYQVYRQTNGGDYELVDTVVPSQNATQSYTIGEFDTSMTDRYFIKAFLNDELVSGRYVTVYSDASNEVTVAPTAAPEGQVQNVSCMVNPDGGHGSYVRITWDAVAGAAGYRIYRSDTAGSYGERIDDVRGNSYLDVSVDSYMPGEYYYYVRAYVEDEDGVYYKAYSEPCRAEFEKVKLTYRPNGGQGDIIEDYVIMGSSDIQVRDCTYTRKGYRFTGWYGTINDTEISYKTDIDEQGNNDSISAEVIDVTFEECKIAYIANNMTEDKVVVEYIAGADVTVIQNTFMYSGRTFVSWNTDPLGKGYEYVPGNNYRVESDLTLYAVWKLDKPANVVAAVNDAGTEIELTWDKVVGADGYYYFVRAYEIIDEDTRRYSDSSDITNKFVVGNAVVEEPDPVGKATNLTVLEFYERSARIGWSGVPAADGYFVYRSIGADGERVRTGDDIKGSNVNTTELELDTPYYYYVVAYIMYSANDTYILGDYSEGLLVMITSSPAPSPSPTPLPTATPNPYGKVTNLTAESVEEGVVNLKWDDMDNVTGFRVYNVDNNAGDNMILCRDVSGCSLTISNLEEGRTYYYCVRGYQAKVGVGFIYSDM